MKRDYEREKRSNNMGLVVDTGILVELLEDSRIGREFYKNFLENRKYEKYYVSSLTDTELKYIFCRMVGYKKAKKIIREFLKDFKIYSKSNLRDHTIHFKCEFSISLADSYTLAVTLLLKIPLCMKKEKEIQENLDELSKKVNIILFGNYDSKE
ncbi:MAG: PIN domain-containing protein [Candidatus Thorarchaeota archaeon]